MTSLINTCDIEKNSLLILHKNQHMDIEKEKKKHFEYLNKDKFIIDVPLNFFNSEKIKLLEKNGHWYNALELSIIKPLTFYQKCFIHEVNNEKLSLIENRHSSNLLEMRLEKINRLKTYEADKSVWKKYKLAKQNWGNLFEILQKSNDDERNILAKILKSKTNSPQDIIEDLTWNSQNILNYLGSETSYTEILEKVAKKLKVKNLNTNNKELEREITISVFESFISKMTLEQKEKFEQEIISIAKNENGTLLKTGGVLSALTAANLSGFGVYLLATSTLSTISGIIGVTLPFAAYTTLTSAISVLIGPLGWATAGVFAIWKITNVNYKKLTPAIIYISWLREKYTD